MGNCLHGSIFLYAGVCAKVLSNVPTVFSKARIIPKCRFVISNMLGGKALVKNAVTAALSDSSLNCVLATTCKMCHLIVAEHSGHVLQYCWNRRIGLSSSESSSVDNILVKYSLNVMFRSKTAFKEVAAAFNPLASLAYSNKPILGPVKFSKAIFNALLGLLALILS